MFIDKDGGKFESKVVLSNAERKTVDQMSHDLEEQRELATNRLSELEKTSALYKDALKEVERLKMELSTLPEHVVVETTEHKCLQSQFSVLYNEAMQLKTQLEEARNQLQVSMTWMCIIFTGFQSSRAFLPLFSYGTRQDFDFPVAFQNRKYLPNCFCCISEYERCLFQIIFFVDLSKLMSFILEHA